MKKPHIILGIGAVLVAMVAFNATRPDTDSSQADEALPIVQEIALSDYQSSSHTVAATGVVESESEVVIHNQVSTPVTGIFVRSGDQVRAGQTLVTFQATDAYAQLSQAGAAVKRAQANLDAQLLGARDEDRAVAGASVAQAEAALEQAHVAYAQTLSGNDDSINDAYDSVNALYANTTTSLRSTLSSLIDGLATVGTYQALYLNCSTDQICYQISDAKAQAMLIAFDRANAGQYTSESVRSVNSGIAQTISLLPSTGPYDGPELRRTLITMRESLVYAQRALSYTRAGLDRPVATAATSTDKAAVEADRASVEAALATVDSLLQQFDTKVGIGLTPRAVTEARRDADQAIIAAQASIQSAEAALATAKAQQTKIETGAREVDLVPYRSALTDAQAMYSSVLNTVRKHTITAPFDGVVADIDLHVGDLPGLGRELLRVVGTDLSTVKASLSVEASKQVSLQNPVRINDMYDGILSALSSVVNEQTGAIDITISVTDPNATLAVGEFVEVEILTTQIAETEESYILPLRAVRTTASGSFVFIKDENTIASIEVEAGRVLGDDIEVRFSDDAPERIVANTRGLEVGQKVQ